MEIKVGTCGWSYYKPPDGWKKKFKSKLQAYADVFEICEINSTFYRIPKSSTAEKWRSEVDEVNKNFEFTIKISQIITHKDKFSGSSFWAFNQMKAVAKILRAKILLFQSPESFKPTKENFELVRKFFNKIEKKDLILVWEVRWKEDWTKEIVEKLFSELNLNQCVDPLRQDCYFAKEIFYYRLHGFGRPMYNYKFSDQELKNLAKKVKEQKKPVFLLFNNSTCYADALRFKEIIS